VQSNKGIAIRTLIRKEFEKGRHETDPEKVEALKARSAAFSSSILVLSSNVFL
jgi:hypothetical protein